MSRPTWEQVWQDMADIIATRSLCCRAQVGCVIVSQDQKVLAASYNGAPPAYRVEGTCENWCERGRGEGLMDNSYINCPAVHAEVNAISRADYSEIKGATAYSTRGTCMNCAKSLAAAGISRLFHRVENIDLHRDPDVVEKFLQDCGIEVLRWTK